jgi:hypothetical protein
MGDSNANVIAVGSVTLGIVNYQKRNRNLLGVSNKGCLAEPQKKNKISRVYKSDYLNIFINLICV